MLVNIHFTERKCLIFHPTPMARQPLVGFTITHTILGKTPLDEWSARRRGL